MKSEWISVEDRVPKNTNDVLVINEEGRMAVSCYFLSRDMYVWEQRDDQIGLGNVTHWIPLPLPPSDRDE